MRRMFLPLLAMATLVAAACTSSAPAAWTYPPSADEAVAGPTSAASAAPEASAPPTSGDVLGALEIQSIDLGFEPTELTVDKAGRYAVTLTNAGQIPHDIAFPDGTKGVANAGKPHGNRRSYRANPPRRRSHQARRSAHLPRGWTSATCVKVLLWSKCSSMWATSMPCGASARNAADRAPCTTSPRNASAPSP